ncbi:glycoside hydrolase N-terminal domain-containing protein [Streptomyces sp. CL12-4]|uniref:glycosyl hydrolase family 95 catalytic domain-containing protein n=1 Tax=Streptomyces sp. CL12-4 TaxID=2810306 RepID=UPI001EFB8D87|nr:glycoside hydrolase N-terminal domain-containing protein [Streptomyces sp. CL12-4]MCG8969130.1 glycoside hydrolase N-terminal domain-containing protein [Streptomyces sp. CL12-4]
MTGGPVHGTWEPEPAARWEDAFLSGNGHHGALVFGDPQADRVVVTHHTLVRPNGGDELRRPPRLAAGLPALQDRLLAGDTTAAEEFTDGRPLQWVRPFHPAFQIRLNRPAGGTGHPYRRAVDFTTGETTAARSTWTSRVFVSRADDVIVQHLAAPHLTLDISLDPRLPGVPAGLGIGHGAVLTPGGALLSLRARYPGSDLAYTGVTLVAVTGGTTKLVPPGVLVEGATEVLLLTRVRRHTGELDVTAQGRALRALADGSLPDGPDGTSGDGPDDTRDDGPGGTPYDALLGRHLALHRTAYDRVTLDLAADPAERALPGSALLAQPRSPALLERLFAAGRYHLLSAGGLLPPRLTGLWTGDWNTAWSGAFTTNANLNLQTASAAAAALPEVTEAHAALVHRQLPDWRDNARAIFGTRGVVAPSHTDGECGHTYHFSREYPLHLWTAGADWLLKPLVDHDETYGVHDPRTTAALAEVALFYEDFLTRTDGDGRLAVVPSYSPENRPANASWGTVDAAMDLSAARHALRTAADRHPEHADRWRALADRLPPHRINADGALAEWARPGLADTYDHRHLSHLYGVWPLDEITPYDTPGLAEAAHRALELRGTENDSAHGHLHHALVAARLGDGARVDHALGRVLDGDYFHASLMSAHYPHRDVYNADAAHALPAVLIEMLVQSTPGRLVLLPALPATCPEGELRGVRTRFGAALDLTWTPDGSATAVLRPDRTHRIDLRTPSGAEPLDLVAGEDRVISVKAR